LKWHIVHLTTVTSTNDYAKEIAEDVPEGTVVWADIQIKGRGRWGREWYSPKGGLWFSVILKPPMVQVIPHVVFIGALAVVDVLSEYGLEGKIKWPNDVLIHDKKIAGVLVEGKANSYVIIGIGINVNNEPPNTEEYEAISMKEELGREILIEEVLRKILRRLSYWYSLLTSGRIADITAQVRKKNALAGREVLVFWGDGKFESGKVLDIEEDGSLKVLLKNGQIRRLVFGEVSLRSMKTLNSPMIYPSW